MQERPVETGYYDLLGVPVDTTTDDIKEAYRASICYPLYTEATNHTGRAQVVSRSSTTPTRTATIRMRKSVSNRLPSRTRRFPTPNFGTSITLNEFGPKESAPEGGFVDPEEVFGAIFGGERFLPLIGHLSLTRDMKTAFQEADATEGADGATPVQRDAKGREIISPEEKAKRDEKVRKVAAEVRPGLHCSRGPVAVDRAALCRKRRRGRSACRSSSRICVTSSAFSQRMSLAQLTPT